MAAPPKHPTQSRHPVTTAQQLRATSTPRYQQENEVTCGAPSLAFKPLARGNPGGSGWGSSRRPSTPPQGRGSSRASMRGGRQRSLRRSSSAHRGPGARLEPLAALALPVSRSPPRPDPHSPRAEPLPAQGLYSAPLPARPHPPAVQPRWRSPCPPGRRGGGPRVPRYLLAEGDERRHLPPAGSGRGRGGARGGRRWHGRAGRARGGGGGG